MKFIWIIVCSVLLLVATASFLGYRNSSDTLTTVRSKLETQAATSKAQIESDAELIESNHQAIADLKKQLGELNNKLAQSTEQLATANQKNLGLEKAEQQRLADEAKRKMVPPPLVNSDGTYLFPKVVNRDGEVLMQSANFISLAANHLLVFRSGDQSSRSFEMDNIHPLILQYLHIDPEVVKEKQRRIEAQGRIEVANSKIQSAIRAQSDEEQRRYNAQLSVEQQKAAAAQQAADAAQAQAIADKQKADAILLNAQKPPQQIQIIQQNRQTVY